MANFGKWVGCIHCAKAGKFNSFQERCRVLWPALSKGWTTGMELDAQCWTSERSLFWIHSLPPEWRNHTLDSYWCYSYLFMLLCYWMVPTNPFPNACIFSEEQICWLWCSSWRKVVGFWALVGGIESPLLPVLCLLTWSIPIPSGYLT